MKKRFLAIFICVILIISMVTTTALAKEVLPGESEEFQLLDSEEDAQPSDMEIYEGEEELFSDPDSSEEEVFSSAEATLQNEEQLSDSEVDYEVGDLIYLGSWPQSLVTEEDLISQLDQLPGESVSLNWREGSSNVFWMDDNTTSTGANNLWYESVNGSSHEADSYISEDVQYQGETYRRITFTEYRTTDIRVSADVLAQIRQNPDDYRNSAPYITLAGDVFDDPNQEINGYYVNTTYYFRYEPLAWRVLDPEKGLILCEKVIDVQPFNNSVYYYFEELYPGYSIAVMYQNSALTLADDYSTSSVRDWLYTDFYQKAFTLFEKYNISQREYSYYPKGFDYDKLGEEGYAGEIRTVDDYVVLPTLDVLTNVDYGFDWEWRKSGGSSGYSLPYCDAYKAEATDFAKCMGAEFDPDAYDTSTHYLLQDAIEIPTKRLVCCVHNNRIGYSSPTSIYGTDVTFVSEAGIRPMMRVSLEGLADQGWFFEDGTLTIENDKAMLYTDTHVPWEQYQHMVKKIEVEQNVTKIVDYAFEKCFFARSAIIKGNIESFGNNVFNGCTQLEYIQFYGCAPDFSKDAFSGVNTIVLYPGNTDDWKEAMKDVYGGRIRYRNDSGYSAIKDGWAIGNERKNFDYGESYHIPFKRYTEIYDLKGYLFRTLLGSLGTAKWEGNCFGMSLLSAANYYGEYYPFSISDQKWFSQISYNDTIGGAYCKIGKGTVRDAVERAHILQLSSALAETAVYLDQDEQDAYYTDMITDIEKGDAGPLVIRASNSSIKFAHAVVLDPSMLPRYLDDEPEWGPGWVELALYDPDLPSDTAFVLDRDQRDFYYNQETYLYLNTENGKWKLIRYDKQNRNIVNTADGNYKYNGQSGIVFYDVNKSLSEYLKGTAKTTIWLTVDESVGGTNNEDSDYKENTKVISFENTGTFTISDQEGTIISVQDDELIESRDGASLDILTDSWDNSPTQYLAGFIGTSDITISGDATNVSIVDLSKEQGFHVSSDAASIAVISADCSSISVTALDTAEVAVTCANAAMDDDSVTLVEQTMEADSSTTITMEEEGLALDAKEGTTLTLTYTNDDFSTSSEVTIGSDPEKVEIDTIKPMITDDSIFLSETTFAYTGEAIEPEVTVTNANGTVLTEGTDYTLEYTDNIEIGKATITCTGIGHYVGSGSVQFSIISEGPVLITLDKSEAEIAATKSLQLKATVTPDDGMHIITWTSSDDKIATVDETGRVTAKKYGKATITASVQAQTASCDIQVLFKDVTIHRKSYFAPVYWAVDQGITNVSVEFRPEDPVNRGEFTAFLYRLAGKPKVSKITTKFKDVNKDTKFAKEISWAVERGIIKGYSDHTFKPTDNITRAQVVIMIWRYAGKPEVSLKKSPFKDVLIQNTDTCRAILWGNQKGIVRGSGGKFLPKDSCTRGNVVTFLYRYVNN